jgi:hypothetical protein
MKSLHCSISQSAEDLAVTFAGGELIPQSRQIEAQEILDMLIYRRVVIKLAVGTRNGGAAFVEEPRQDDVTAKAAARASRRSFRQIRGGGAWCVRHDQSTIGRGGGRSKILLLFDFQFRIGSHAFMKHSSRASAI